MGHATRVGRLVTRGLRAASLPVLLLWLALLPSRLSVAMRVRGGTTFDRVTRALAGAVVDVASVLTPMVVLIAVLTLALLLAKRLRTDWWQHHGATVVTLPLCFGFSVLALIEQEVKAERGAFPTMSELLRSGTNASFLEGVVGFVRYERMWVPAVACLLVAVVLVRWWLRRPRAPSPWRPWSVGFLGALAAWPVGAAAMVSAQGRLSARLAPGGLGAPLAALVESTADALAGRPPEKPAALLQRMRFTTEEVATGAARLGWPVAHPSTHCHSHARELDGEAPSPATPLLRALERVSRQLFADGTGEVAVFQFSLESYRADDLHALNPAAPRALEPFTNALYEAAHADEGVLASPLMFQAGVRTAQGLAAMTCGVGTLPWNLALIRDVDDFPLRCWPDLLAEAGFHGAFFYGSDASYDGMARFATRHGLREVVSQAELPPNLPRGAWGGLTDRVMFEQAVTRVATALEQTHAPQLALVMSLSNHSPFTRPEDATDALEDVVTKAIEAVPNRARSDDRRRLLTHAYTDAALETFFASLRERHLAERSIVVLMADHSTGTDYVWGGADFDHETDAAKAKVPFVIVLPPEFLARVKDRAALRVAFREAQAELDTLPLSQNDVPTLMLALLSAHPGLRALPSDARWHTLGGQATSPFFRGGGEPSSFLVGVNGVDEVYAVDRHGVRSGPYEDAVFLQTLGDGARVTPRLIPIAATVVETMRQARCP